MNKELVSYVLCPTCGSDKIILERYICDGDAVQEGRLICESCRIWYRIEDGIVDLLPLSLRRNNLYENFVKKHNLSLDKAVELDNKQKKGQIEFFTESSKSYEEEVTNSPYFMALDKTTFSDWIERNLKPGQQVLEIGCGTGRQCIPMAQHNVHIVSIDISEEMLLMAKKRIDAVGVGRFVSLVVADAESPPVKDNSFDACVMVGTLHHVENPEIVIIDASEKIVSGGTFFSYDPHQSPVRFIFDFVMKLWKLYDEEASDDPLLTEKQLSIWLQKAGIRNDIRISTFLLPHIFYLFNESTNIRLLKYTDIVFGSIPLIKRLGGMIIAEGRKEP